MPPLTNELLAGLAIMIVLSMWLGSSGRARSSSLRSFYWGDSELPAGHGAHLMVSSPFSMNGIMYQTVLGYSIGWAAVLVQVAWSLSYLLLAANNKRIERLCREGTLHGAIGSVYGQQAEKAAAVASILGFALQVGWELIVGVSIFLVVAPTSVTLQTILILSLAVIGAVYTIMGGLRGNLNANRLQNYVAGIALIGIIVFLIARQGQLTSFPSGAHAWDPGSIGRLIPVLGLFGLITNIAFSLFWQFVDMSTWQNIAATKREQGKSMLTWSSLWTFVFPGVVGTLAGMYLRTIPNLNSENIVPTLILVVSSHPWIAVFVTAGFVAAMLSTIDGLLLASAQAITWDLTRRETVRKLLSQEAGVPDVDAVAEMHSEVALSGQHRKEQGVLQETRIWVLLVAIIGAGVTFWITKQFHVSIFDLVYIVTVAQMVLLPVVLTILLGSDRPRTFGAWSIGGGLAGGTIAVISGLVTHSATLLAASPLIGLGIATLLWIPSSLSWGKK